MSVLSRLALLLVLLAPGVAIGQSPGGVTFERGALTIETARGQRHAFQIELALTPAQQAQGLMFRRALAPDAGMLFVNDGEREIAMWMRNTLIPLDMIFIRADGRIARIAERTVPHSLDTVASGGPALAVLEVAAGTADRLGLRPGDRVRHPAFRE
jgi:hypothetical protein